MTYYIKGFESKKFVTLGISDSMPSRDDVINTAKKNPKVKKVWVMKMEGNKWNMVMDTINV